MDRKGNKNSFDYEAFRQETIAKMMAGERELTGKDGGWYCREKQLLR